jgi:hypothetical protein
MADTPVAIDPIGVETQRYSGLAFPFFFPATSIYTAPNPPIQMYRVTLAACGGNLADPNVRLALAERIFRWRDDLQFDMPGERTERPRQQFRLATGAVGFGPLTTAAEIAGNPLMNSPEQVAEAEGAYSWMATVMPDQSESGLGLLHRKYVVSTVVFYNRDLTLQRELSCGVTPSVVGGVQPGGGDFTLFVSASPDSDAVREKLMGLKQGDWILLRGMKPGPPVVYAFKWYRVAALGEFAPASGSRLVTLAGPDWDTSFGPPTGAIEAGLFDRVVGVYTQTVEVDR